MQKRPLKAMPPPLRIRHPDRPEVEREEKPKPETDSLAIAAFFGRMGGKLN